MNALKRKEGKNKNKTFSRTTLSTNIPLTLRRSRLKRDNTPAVDTSNFRCLFASKRQNGNRAVKTEKRVVLTYFVVVSLFFPFLSLKDGQTGCSVHHFDR